MTRHQPTAAVRESFGQAQQQAAAMVAGPPTPWNEGTRGPHGSVRRLGIAAVSVAVAAVGGWLAADWLGGPGRAAPTAVPPPADPLVDARPAAPLPAVTPAIAAAPTPAEAAALTVTRQAGVIRIEARQAPLTDVVRALAQATHTDVKGGEALAAIATPVTLQWQGTDVPAAWDALLGRHASIGVSCGTARCALWIVGVTPPRRAASATGTPNGATAEVSETAPLPRPAVPAAPPPPPGNDENTETN